jgi:hypothetical protein
MSSWDVVCRVCDGGSRLGIDWFEHLKSRHRVRVRDRTISRRANDRSRGGRGRRGDREIDRGGDAVVDDAVTNDRGSRSKRGWRNRYFILIGVLTSEARDRATRARSRWTERGMDSRVVDDGRRASFSPSSDGGRFSTSGARASDDAGSATADRRWTIADATMDGRTDGWTTSWTELTIPRDRYRPSTASDLVP